MTSTTADTVPPAVRRASRRAKKDSLDGHRFQCVRAVQAGRIYYVTACPLRLVPEILTFASADLPPEVRAQRALNKGRIPAIARYLTSNPTSYVLSAITASIDADVRFDGVGELRLGTRLGVLVVPHGATVFVNDGQHRREAIAMALRSKPELGDESVPLVLFLDAGLRRNQQTFADLNRHAIRPPTSLNVLYDRRSQLAELARRVAFEVPPFQGLTELERSSLSNRSSKMFTLSAIHQATAALLGRLPEEPPVHYEDLVLDFWRTLGRLICGWGIVSDERTASELRRNYIHVHAVALHALGMVGGELIARYPRAWKSRLRRLDELDWSRTRPIWDGRAIRNGKISKSNPALVLTANVLRAEVGLALGATEIAIEETLPRKNRVPS